MAFHVVSDLAVFLGGIDKAGQLVVAKRADGLRGRAERHPPVGDVGRARHERARAHEASLAHFGVVDDDRAHSDERSVSDFAAVDDGAMADRHVLADTRHLSGVHVNAAVLLDIRAGSNLDASAKIAADRRAFEHGDVGSDRHVADDGRIFRDMRLGIDVQSCAVVHGRTLSLRRRT